MKVHDRYSDREVDLPSSVEPGRYRMLRAAVLNRVIKLNVGDVLWSDGGLTCELDGGEVRNFVQLEEVLDDSGASESIIDDAVQAVVEQWSDKADVLPSPVMPASLGDLAKPTSLEIELGDVLAKGHLQTIAARPQRTMRYESEMLPVARARRLAGDAVTRLASHSEDWLRREITGVVPKAVKAEVSEDDLVIYENVVFARLLDRIELVLRRRLRDVEALRRKHDEAAKLSDADQLDYRLRGAICRLWGLSFADDPAAGKAAADTVLLIQFQLGKVRQLKLSEVYAAVPRSHRIPLALRSTNILRHDAHYMRLQKLWLLAHAGAKQQPLDAPARFAAEKTLGERFHQYVGLLIQHALAACKLVQSEAQRGRRTYGGRLLEVEGEPGAWTLRLEGAAEPLQFVSAWRGVGDWLKQRSRRLVFCHRPSRLLDPGVAGEPGADGVLHPLEFYCVERVRQAIEEWLTGAILRNCPPQVASVPTELRDRIVRESGNAARARGHGLVVERPISAAARRAIEDAISSVHTNPETQRAIGRALDDAHLLATCRLCGASWPDTVFEGSATGFKATCGCGHTWRVKYQEGRVTEAAFHVSTFSRKFDQVGSLDLKLQVP